ncbi:MAG: glycosyltransferase family 9 protein [Acidobacteriota bacterium]
MKKILVVQLCRIGDILMTGPLLRGLRREHPSAEISLMVMDAFAATPLPPHLYDRLLSFPLGGLAGLLAARDGAWEPALDTLRAFLRGCTHTPFDLVVNLTHTDMSALVTSLVPARKRVGLVLRSDRRRGVDSAWMTHMRAAVRSRDISCFHLVDMFAWTAGIARDAGGLEIDVTPDDRAWAARFIAAREDPSRPLIAMQLGASAESKQWPVERFAALADALDPALGDILLIGGPQEGPLATAFRGVVHRPVLDSIGSTSLRQLGALLQRCRVLITNDTGPMHVASAVGTPVIDMSSGPVSAHETGPYGAGHLVIEPETACYPCPLDSECHHYACRFALTPEDAAAVARFAMGAGPAPRLTGARLLRARRTAVTGRIEFVPIGSPLTVKDRVRMEAAAVWERTLAAPPRVGEGWGDADDAVSPMPADPARMSAIDAHLREVAREADAAAVAVRGLTHAAPAKVQSLADGVHATLERLLAIGESERAVHPLVTHLRHEIESVNASDLAGMARAQAVAYRATAVRARMLADALAG